MASSISERSADVQNARKIEPSTTRQT